MPASEADGARVDGAWDLWIDTGGTFTDCLARDPEGRLHRAKVLSSSRLRGRVESAGRGRLTSPLVASLPADFLRGYGLRLLDGGGPVPVASCDPATSTLELAGRLPRAPGRGEPVELLSPEEAPLLAARLVTGRALEAPLPPLRMRLATTRGTNALLERRGAATALFITRGFGDLLRIGNQQRPELFSLRIVKPEPLYAAVVEVDERLDAAGEELLPLDLEPLRQRAAELVARGVDSAAVALLHSHRQPRHELLVAGCLRGAGFRHVSTSAELAPFIRILPRAETAVVNAYLAEVIDGYRERVRRPLGGGSLHLMTSAGGLVRAAEFQAKDSLLSGPAGGVVGAAAAGRRSGLERVIAFDMGGTSTDVSRHEERLAYRFETRVGSARLLAPALAIETVAAGGGSICSLAGGRLRVGPRSAGARPGPACYGAGGPLTLTDVNLLLGRLAPERAGIPIDREAAMAAAAELAGRLAAEGGAAASVEQLLAGCLRIANETMARAVHRISIRQGRDPATYALVAFGGAGPQHACGLAELLVIDRCLVPADAGLLSACGLGAARIERFAERQVLRPLAAVAERVGEWLERLEAEAIERLGRDGVGPAAAEVRRRPAELRLAGQDASLLVEAGSGRPLADAFAAAYRDRFGYPPPKRPLELVSLRVVASSAEPASPPPLEERPATASPAGERRAWFGDGWRRTPVFDRSLLAPGHAFAGPALILEEHCTTVVEPGWRGRVDGAGALLLERSGRRGEDRPAARPRGEAPRAVELELFANRFRGVVEQMGETLRRTALSVNVKERLDFSCGLLDGAGRLVVNAPHIPVHLGALGPCVRSVVERLPLRPGDVAVTNHPAFGGSHLPDVTVITPVWPRGGGRPSAYLASRAHHAEIGGSRPGSMPPDAVRLAEEGVILEPQLLVEAGEPRWERLRARLTGGHFPSRAVEENLIDLEAAVAANRQGAAALASLADEHGDAGLRGWMTALARHAAEQARAALGRLGGGRFAAREELDDGTPLVVELTLRDGGARVDFAGSGGVHPGNLNATPAVVRSAVLYVLRLLIDEPLPLNEGLLEPVEIRLPAGLLNPDFSGPPESAPAVVGGNVETSQRVVDLLLKALGAVACSQGTMNNVVFGDQRFGYYETVCGGAGAGPGFAGADAVHTHMTNTAITDPELLEHRYPVRLERFEIRRDSGGRGAWAGGRGVIRELRFLAPVSLSLLTQHRCEGPYGAAGGGRGRRGRQRLLRAGGEVEELGSIDGREVRAGDRLLLETPGGGGWGPAATGADGESA